MAATTDEGLTPTTGRGGSRRRWFALGFMSLGVSMVMIDATIINVAIPVISADLSLTPTDIEWVNSIYSLVFASLLIIAGKAGDVLGRRLIFMLGAAIFLVSSLIAARANAGEVLILGRFIQGIGGAMMIPASLSLLNTLFRGRERGIAFAVWGATIGCVAAIGPLLGGFLTTNFSWRWAFLINLPIAIALVVGTLLFVPESKDENAKRGVDVVGVIASALALGGFVFALIEGQRYGWLTSVNNPKLGGFDWTWSVSPAAVAFVVAAVAAYTFIAVEKRRARAGKVVLLDLDLFKIPSFTWGQVVGMLIMFGEFGILLTMPLFLQNVLGYSAIHTGAILAMVMVGALVSTPPSGRLVNKWGALAVVRIGLSLELLGMLGLAWSYSVDATTWSFVPWLLLFGMGVGLSTAQITNVVLNDVPVHKGGQASGTQSATRQIGVALGVAVLGAVLWISLANNLDRDLEARPGVTVTEAREVTDRVVNSAGTALPGLRASDPELAAVADQSYTDATRLSTFVGGAFLFFGLLATFAVRPSNAPKRDSELDAGPDPEPSGDDPDAPGDVSNKAATI